MAHQREAERRAASAVDPERQQALRHEAEVHARAAAVHREAAELQREHARQHEP